jgi:hypothetical protein
MLSVEPYLDSNNQELWQTMSQGFNIVIDYSPEGCYGNYHQSNDCTIYVPIGKEPDPASFSHELLHLYLSHYKIYIGGAIECLFRERYPHNIIFDKGLYDHITNCLEHIKMLPLYLKLGYPIEKFLLDYYEEKLTFEDLKRLRKGYKSGIFSYKFNRRAVNFYIGQFFAAKADINPTNYYDKLLSDMNQLDTTLYSALDTFWNGWVNYDVEKKREVWEDDYHVLVDKLADDLSDWSKNKIFV